MQVCVSVEHAPKRVNWSNEIILSSALNLLKKQGLKAAAKQLSVSRHALRQALNRRGLEFRTYAGYKKNVALPVQDRIFEISRFEGVDPFLAQEAITNKPDNGCSWPIGDLAKGHFNFCGKPRTQKAYCGECAKLAYI